MARTKYTVTFPAAKAGDEVTWPNSVKVYADANIDRPLGNGYIETAAGSFTGWSDAASVTFTRAGTSDSVTVTTGSPTGTGAAVPSAASGAGLPSTIVSKTTTYAATAGDFVECDTTSAGFTVTLPSAPAAGALVAVKKISNDTNTLTIAAAGAGTIDGQATATTITQWAGIIVEHKGSDVWRIAASMSTTGPAGTNGNTVLNGSGAPSAGTGANGDFYIDTTAKNIYGPKAAGAWGSGTAMLGAITTVQAAGVDQTVRAKLNFTGTGATVTDDAANGRTNIAIAGGGGGGLLPRAFRSGAYVAQAGSVTTLSMSLGFMYLFPFEVFASTTFVAIGLNVTTLGTTSVVRLGVYADSSGMPPSASAPVFDAGTIDSTTTGMKEIVISQTLAAGIYWVAARATGGSGPSVQATNNSPVVISSFSQAGAMQNQCSGYADGGGGSGVLPSTLTGFAQQVSVPRVALKTT